MQRPIALGAGDGLRPDWRRPDALTDGDLERLLGLAAIVVALHGDGFACHFEALERELARRRSGPAARARALAARMLAGREAPAGNAARAGA